MKYIHISVIGARSHPDINVKTDKNSELQKYIDSSNNKLVYFISFTSIPKIGINPQFNYGNPIGVYAYPLTNNILKDSVSFATDRPFIQVLKSNTKKILTPKTYNNSKLLMDLNNLQNIIDKNKSKIQQNLDKYDIFIPVGLTSITDEDFANFKKSLSVQDLIPISNKIIKSLASTIKRKKKSNNSIQHIWNISRIISSLLSSGENVIIPKKNSQSSKNTPKRYTIIWNKLLRSLGYGLVIDTGIGFIHPNEPCQAVFLSSNSYKHIDCIDNKIRSRGNVNKPNNLKKFININTQQELDSLVLINHDIQYIKGTGLEISSENNKITIEKGLLTSDKKLNNFNINCTCYNTSFNSCNFLANSNINHDNITNSELNIMGYIYNSTIENSIINRGLYIANNNIINCKITGGTFYKEIKSSHLVLIKKRFNLKSINVKDTIIENSTISGGTFNDIIFINCKFTVDTSDEERFINCLFS